MWFFREIIQFKAHLLVFYQGCKTYSIKCFNCNTELGYYFMECTSLLKEFEGKYGLLCNKSVKDQSLFCKTNQIIKEVHEINDRNQFLEKNLFEVEAEILRIMMVVKFLQKQSE